MSPQTADNQRSRKWTALMQRAQDGDRAAFCELVNEIGPAIANFLRCRIGDRQELEDVCQETLLAIYQSRHTYDPFRPLEPWIFAIARYIGANHFKRYASRASWQELRGEIPEEGARDSGGLRARLQQAIAQLPELQREALMMMQVEGLSLLEASERTGANVGALKVRMHRAYEALKKALLG
jgi:RNA polymerase sigma factor (sigma-70 family)